MPEATRTLDEVKDLYAKVFGQPAPEIDPAFYAPFPPGVDPVRHAADEVEALRKLSETLAAIPPPPAWIPRADVLFARDACVIRLEVPGVPRESLHVFVTGRECVVRGELRLQEGPEALRPVQIERPFGPFERRFALSPELRSDGLTARCEHGVLELRLPLEKAPEGGRERTVEVA